jgi:5'-methylthioadenosine phosphorylase
VEAIVKVLFDNADKARTLVRALVPSIGAPRPLCRQKCDRALDNAVITARTVRSAVLAAKLDAVSGRVLRGD